MIQQICKQEDHDQQIILGACLNSECQKPKMYCGECKYEFHDDHFQDLFPFKKLQVWQNQRKEQAKAILDQIDKIQLILNQITQTQNSIITIKDFQEMNEKECVEQIQLLTRSEKIQAKLNETLNEFQEKFQNLMEEKQKQIPQQQFQQIKSQEMYETPTANPDDQMKNDLPLRFLFSKTQKGNDIKISQNQTILISDAWFQFALLEPELNSQSINKLRIKIVEKRTTKNQHYNQSHTGIGLCSSADQMAAQEFKVDPKNLGNEIYIISDVGNIFTFKGSQQASNKRFKFVQGDILLIQVDLKQKQLTFINETWGEIQNIDLDVNQSNLRSWHFCVYSMTYKIEILDD